MMVQHHLDQATIVRYASGDLDEAFMVVVAAHLAMCETCRQDVRTAETAGGALFEASNRAELADSSFEALMVRIDSLPDDDEVVTLKPQATPLQDEDHALPKTLQRFLPEGLDAIRWKRVAPGVKKYDLNIESERGTSLYLLNIAAGKSVPQHGHGGSEMTLVLSGAYRDNLGRFAAGDIADLDEHLEHQPHVEPGEPCICLVATEAPTRFKGLVSRLMQPLVGV